MTFVEVENYLSLIRRVREIGDFPIVLCTNFCYCDNKVVTKEEGEKMAQKYNVKFFETSSSEYIDVDNAFEYLIDRMI